jgi:outer membrane protein
MIFRWMIKHSRFLFISLLSVIALLPISVLAQDEVPVKLQMLSLADGLRLATEESRVMKIAAFNKELASQDISIARSRFFPVVNAQANYTMLAYQPGAIFGPQRVRTADKDYPSYGINVHQTLYDFGARGSLYKASQESLELTLTDIFRTKNLIALDFINVYFSLLEAERMILVGSREVEALAAHQQMANNLYDAGAITKNDLLQAGVKLSDAHQRLLTLRNLRTFNSSRINNVLSRPLNGEIAPVEVVETTAPPPVLEKSWETAMLSRPEIKIIDQELRINELQEAAKRSEYLPTLFADGGYNYSKNQFMIHEDNWSFVVGLNFNIFSGGATKAGVAKIRLRSEQIREEKNKLIDDIKLEVQRYYLDESSASDNVLTTKDAIRQAEENLRINKVRYEEGVGTATDVLDAISLLTLAEKNYYKALYDMRRAHAGLLYATGEDLSQTYK